MTEPNGNGANRILSLDQASRNAKDAHGRHLRHNATVLDVYQIVAEESAKIHEFYLAQVPPHVARMIQDALMAYGLIKLTDEALAAVPTEPQPDSNAPAVAESVPDGVGRDTPEPDSMAADPALYTITKTPFRDTLTGDPRALQKVSDVFPDFAPTQADMEAEALAILARIEAGLESVRMTDERPTGCEPVFETASGWRFRVFDDAGDFDYIDAFAPPGQDWITAPPLGAVFSYPATPAKWGWAVDGASPSNYTTTEPA